MKKFLTVALEIEHNEDDNPYPIQDKNHKPKTFGTLDKAMEYSDKLFDNNAVHTMIIEYEE